jgi:N-acetylglucosaminyldiphosphoundecaprenol N-acetyl-beta-D-mannosaminyltransferase
MFKKENTVSLFDYPIFNGTLNQACEIIERLTKTPGHHRVVTLNPEMIVTASVTLKEWIKKSDLILPDGTGLIYAIKLIHGISCQRLTGIDVLESILSRYSLQIYLVGSTSEIVEKTVKNLQEKYPNITIVGHHHGYLTEVSQRQLILHILEKKPDLVLIGMGFIKQEQFAEALSKQYDKGVSIGVGGVFDVWSGRIQRAPLWMQKNGLEWTYRYIKDPKRIKRILFLPRFLIKVFLELW